MSLPDLPKLSLEFLGIAEGRVFDRPLRVQTLLGSCVAVTMFCRVREMGGIFHGLLPRRSEFEPERRDGGTPYRYVDSGVEALYRAMAERGADMAAMEAKVFGGAGALAQEAVGVGLKNVRAALDTLTRLNVRVTAANVGGRLGRKLYFLPHSGEVFLKTLTGSPDRIPEACRLDR